MPPKKKMGLGDPSGWKKRWRELAPGAFYAVENLLATMAAIRYVIEDAQGTMYTLATGVSAADELLARIRNYAAEQLTQFATAAGVVYVGDTSRRPPNKAVRRDAHAAEPIPPDVVAAHAAAFAWDAPDGGAWADLEALLLADAPPSRSVPFRRVMGRVMRTTPLRAGLFAWFAEQIRQAHGARVAAAPLAGPPPWLVLDGLGDESVRAVGEGADLAAAAEHGAGGGCEREGEADLQVVRVAERLLRHGDAIWVRSRDTDITLSLLLSAGRWPAGARVWLDLGGADVIDVGALRAGLLAWDAHCDLQHGARVADGAATVVAMLGLMGGSDYVEKPEGLGMGRMWPAYRSVGHDFFNPVPPLPAPGEPVDGWAAWGVAAAAGFVRYAMSVTKAGAAAKTPRGLRYGAVLDRRRHNRRPCGPPIEGWARKLRKRLPPPDEAVAEAAGMTWKQGVVPWPADRILVYAAQVAWNTLYLAGLAVDPLEAEDGVSRWGWERGPDGAVRRAARVAWAL